MEMDDGAFASRWHNSATTSTPHSIICVVLPISDSLSLSSSLPFPPFRISYFTLSCFSFFFVFSFSSPLFSIKKDSFLLRYEKRKKNKTYLYIYRRLCMVARAREGRKENIRLSANERLSVNGCGRY